MDAAPKSSFFDLKSPGHSFHYAGTKSFVVPPDFTDQSSSKANCSVPTALPQLPPPFVIRAIALLTHAGWLSA